MSYLTMRLYISQTTVLFNEYVLSLLLTNLSLRVHSVSSVIALQYIQVFAPLGRTADSRQHATELRQRARLPRLLARHGHHHLLDDHVLRREERRGHQVPQHPGRLLVHHRHHDNAPISLSSCASPCSINKLLQYW